MLFIFQVKQNSDKLISEVHSMLVNHKTFDVKNAFWFSLIEKINVKLRKKDENIATITSIEGMLRVLVLYYTGLLPFFPVHDKVFGITLEEVRAVLTPVLTAVLTYNTISTYSTYTVPHMCVHCAYSLQRIAHICHRYFYNPSLSP